jgi:hypothetical protein
VTANMTDSPPDGALPAMASTTLLLAHRPNLLVGLNQFCVWPTGLRFTLSIILRAQTERTPALAFTPFDVPHDGDLPFKLTAIADSGAGPVELEAWSTQQVVGGFGLFPAGMTGSFGPTSTAHWDAAWWLSPLPSKTLGFDVSCDALGLDSAHADVDTTSFAELATRATSLEPTAAD